MKAIHDVSNSLNSWGRVSLIFAFILIFAGCLAIAMAEATFAVTFFALSGGCFISAPVLRGFSIIVYNAETEKAEEEKARRAARAAEKEAQKE